MVTRMLTEEETAITVASSLLKYSKKPRANHYESRETLVYGYFSGLNRDMRRKYVSVVGLFDDIFLFGGSSFSSDVGKNGEASIKGASKLPKAKALHYACLAAEHKIAKLILVEIAGACTLGSIFSRYETLKNIEQVSS